MYRDQLKDEITKALETVPEDILEDLLDYLKVLIKNPKEKTNLARNLRKIIHEFLINKFGGSHGIRDKSLLESALARPFQTFDQVHLHESHYEKAAALI